MEKNSSSNSKVKYRGVTVEECQRMLQKSLQTPMVKALLEHIEKAGCKIGKNFIKVQPCQRNMAGGYVRGHGIILCSNHLRYQMEVDQVLKHELIHAYDQCRAANLNWRNCGHHACSEIRANHLSGDCHLKLELLRGFMKLRGHGQECVKRRVLKSLESNPSCSKSAKDAMEAVWNICYNDTKPFKRAP